MTCFRRRRLRSRVAWLALFALLWTQVTLASHGLCFLKTLGDDPVAVEMAPKHDCHDSTAGSTVGNAQALVCVAHCSQSDQSSDYARVPLLAAISLERWFSPTLPTLVDAVSARPLRDPRGHRHRPTAHPATLLLI